MTSKCSINRFEKDKTADFPMVNQKPCIAKWGNLDLSGNEWAGEFAFTE